MGSAGMIGRVITIGCMCLAPALAMPARGAKAAIPRRVSEAGRDDGLYRRLKLREAQLVLRANTLPLLPGPSPCPDGARTGS
jgi:hypothetical protein